MSRDGPVALARYDTGLADPQRQRLPFHGILHRQHALLEKLALGPVRRFGGIMRYRTSLLPEVEVAVAGSVGRL
jgi:hypothetical protein